MRRPSWRLIPSDDPPRTKKQCEKFLLLKGRLLRPKLKANGEGSEHQFVDGLEAVRCNVVNNVCLTMEHWSDWRLVIIDLHGLEEAMRSRQDWGDYSVPDLELDEYLAMRWEAIVEELEPLRAKMASLEVELKGWREDPILKKLEKDGKARNKEGKSKVSRFEAN